MDRADGRAPLFEWEVVLYPAGPTAVAVWSGGVQVIKACTCEGLQALATALKAGEKPDWLESKGSTWSLESVGAVVEAVADRMLTEGCEPALRALYGGKKLGPANPDMRVAGVVIDDDDTVTWVSGPGACTLKG